MFGRRGKTSPSINRDKIENVIGVSAVVKGMLKSTGSIRLDGVVEGEIETSGDVIVGESGKAYANINAQGVSVSGLVKGNISASGKLEIASKGKVWGDIEVASLAIEEGGVFRGQSKMTDEALAKELAERSQPESRA